MSRDWSSPLASAIARCAVLRRVVVVEETETTQDDARRLGPRAGDVVVAKRQTGGRGRRGRRWADTGDAGVAVSFVVDAAPAERLVLATAVGAARAAEATLPDGTTVGIKWPNDLVVRDRKLAGILVEQDARHAVIGVGVNVAQESWPDELAGAAISLRELGGDGDRLELLTGLVGALDASFRETDDELASAYAARDALAGRTVAVRAAGTRLTGRVVAADPRRGLVIDAGDGPVTLPAATTSIERVETRKLTPEG